MHKEKAELVNHLLFFQLPSIKPLDTLNFMMWQVNSNEEADEIEAFVASRVNPSIVMNLNLSIEKIRIKARWIQSVSQEHSLPDLIKQLAQRKQ